MSTRLQLRHAPNAQVEIGTDGDALLWRYVYAPTTPANEAPRPYAHPVYSLHGDILTNLRPHDHPWHHGLSFTLTSVGGVNFWGGPTYSPPEGYRWRDDHGRQTHRVWLALEADAMVEELDWTGRDETLLREVRRLETRVTGDGWSLRWTSELRNVSGRALALDNYHSRGGLVGSHYTGLQFRGARDLLVEPDSATGGITAEGGRAGEAAVHGAEARWMDWACRHDGSLRRTRIRFESCGAPSHWFVRAKNPLAAFAFHREHSQSLAAGATLRLEHLLTFTPA